MTQRNLVELNRSECLELLRRQQVGRIAYTDSVGPVAVPVNFALAGDDVVVRMERSNRALYPPNSGPDAVLAFEVDHVDADDGSGWSVVVRGRAREVTLDAVPDLLRGMSECPPRPFAEGVHNVWLRIQSQTMTGRRLDAYAAPLVM